MNEVRVLDIIEQQFRAARLPLPEGLERPHTRKFVVWGRIARALASECDTDCRAAARAASMAGAMITRGRTRL